MLGFGKIALQKVREKFRTAPTRYKKKDGSREEEFKLATWGSYKIHPGIIYSIVYYLGIGCKDVRILR